MSRKWLLSLILIVPVCSASAESSNQDGISLSDAVGNAINLVHSAMLGMALTKGGFLGPNGDIAGGVDPLKIQNTQQPHDLAENDGVLSSRVRESIKRNSQQKLTNQMPMKLQRVNGRRRGSANIKVGIPNPGEAEMYKVKDVIKELMRIKALGMIVSTMLSTCIRINGANLIVYMKET